MLKLTTILIIEDNEQLLFLNMRILEDEGYAVLPAHTFGEARRLLETHSPKAIVTDMDLPDGSGLDFCLELRNPDSHLSVLNPKLLHVPIIFLTGRNSAEEMAAGYAAGADDYISKPYRIERLTESLEALIKAKMPPDTNSG